MPLVYGRSLWLPLIVFQELISILSDGLDRGIWLSPDRLEYEPDMTSLRPLPEFQKMVAVCQQRFAEIQPTVRPELIVQQPAKQVGRFRS